ncbi:MAG: DUF2817 domain-containing protein [Fuerstiella sp.]
MWFPPHIRQNRFNDSVLLMMMILCGCVPLAGCSSLPKLDTAPPPLTARPDATGDPARDTAAVFDDSESDPRIANSGSQRAIVSAPEPFAWTPVGTSAGGRPIDSISLGQGGYRTLVLGSLSGHDPLAIQLTEQFARHVHEQSIILGGVQTVFVHSPNPDGAALARRENENGIVLNREFPDAGSESTAESASQPETQVIHQLLRKHQPQRVIHLRTYPGDRGVVAASAQASSAAADVAEWLGFELITLPGQSRAGTLERFLSEQDSTEIITFAFPETSDSSTLWETYGDTLMNLLLDDDFQTRTLARTRGQQNSADRRTGKNRANAPRPAAPRQEPIRKN